MEEKDLPEQMMELTEGKIDREQAELLIRKIRVAYEHPKQWMACFPGLNTARCQQLSREECIAVWKLVERSLQQADERLPAEQRLGIVPINISARIQGYKLLNGAMDFNYARRQERRQDDADQPD